jgi:hypothetical protein
VEDIAGLFGPQSSVLRILRNVDFKYGKYRKGNFDEKRRFCGIIRTRHLTNFVLGRDVDESDLIPKMYMARV